MTTPRWRLILNGKSAGNDALRDAVGHWRGQGVQLEVRVTWEDGDAERYVAEAIDHGVDVIVAAGGDGTLSAVAETLAHREEPADALPSLALIPMGTANDFATSAGIPTAPKEAFALIAQAVPHAIDLLRVDADGTPWWCANLASGGFGTQVTVETDAGLKKMLGGLAYVITGIAKLGRIEPISARLSGPDFAWEGDFIALGIGNGRQAGGGHVLCPEASVDDGLLDVGILPAPQEIAGALRELLAGEGLFVRARLPWVEIKGAQGLDMNLDGEPLQAASLRFEALPGALRVHLPKDSPLLSHPG